MSRIRAEVKQLAADMELGEQRSGLMCPSCGGGLSADRSFSIEREAQRANYCCHRSSCGWKGSVNMSALAVSEIPKRAKWEPEPIKMLELPDDAKQILKDRYHFSVDEILLSRSKWSDSNKLVLPIIDRFSNTVGYVLRSLDGSLPKSKIFMTRPENPCMAWYPKQHGFKHLYSLTEPVLIVEDQLSAIRASKYITAVALLGTHISDHKLSEIKKTGTSSVVLALDEDATSKSAGYVTRLSGLFDRVRMRYLKKDLKDCTDEELVDVLDLKET